MAKDKLTDYSATNSLNTDVGGISIDEGMLPSNVNDAIREVMTHLKDFAEGTQAVNAVAVDNLKLDANTLSSTNLNGNIVIDPNGTGSVQLGGNLDTNGNDITFGDGDKAIFGAGSDLQIYHDANNSYVQDQGTGSLRLGSDSVVQIGKATAWGELMAQFTADGGCELRHDNVAKLNTTSGGIDVTGTVTADEFVADSAGTLGNSQMMMDFSAPNGRLQVKNTSGAPAANMYFLTTDGAGNTRNRVKVDDAGDFVLYADDGTTEGFFWDASAQRLGLGTTAPDTLLHLSDATGGAIVRLERNDTVINANDIYGEIQFEGQDASAGSSAGIRGKILGIAEDSTGAMGLAFHTAAGYSSATEQLRITSGGSVGIGTSSISGWTRTLSIASSGESGIRFDGAARSWGIGGGNSVFRIYDFTGSSEALRIDTSGRLGLGTTSPAYYLDLQNSTGGSLARFKDSDSAYNGIIIAGDTNGGWVGNNSAFTGEGIYYQNSINALRFYRGGSEEMRLNATGLGIGTASPATLLHTQSSVADAQIRFESTHPSGVPNLQLKGAGSATIRYLDESGTIQSRIDMRDSGFVSFHDSSSQKMTLDASGNLLVGKTTASSADNGVFLSQNSGSYFTRDGGYAGLFNRRTSDGEVVQIRKDNTTVGSIGTTGGDLYIGTGDTCLRFQDATDSIAPRGTNGAVRDAAIDLGVSSQRFKDLYLSGGVYLGGTGASNLLDDYEEGTWTPVAEGETTAGTGTYNYQVGSYVKIGDMVQIQASIQWTAHSGSGVFRLTGLPFTSKNTTNLFSSCSAYIEGLPITSNYRAMPFMFPNASYINVNQANGSGSPTNVNIDSAAALLLTATYRV